MNNRMWNIKNPYQGDSTKVLCVCSAGLLRSPTLAKILGEEPFNCNTRSAGIDVDHALIPVDEALVAWADIIFCMNAHQKELLLSNHKSLVGAEVMVLDVPDNFSFMQPELVTILKDKVAKYF